MILYSHMKTIGPYYWQVEASSEMVFVIVDALQRKELETQRKADRQCRYPKVYLLPIQGLWLKLQGLVLFLEPDP